MKTMITLLQREYWENRGSFAITPIAIGGFFVVLLIFALFSSPALVDTTNEGMAEAFGIKLNAVNISVFDLFGSMTVEFANLSLEQREKIWTIAFYGMSGLFIAIMVLISAFYLLGSLYDDRRDRSILFWKSLPVSDLMTVSSKVIAVAFVIPALFCIALLLTYVSIMLIASLVAMVSSGSVWASIIQPAPFLSVPLKIFTGHIIHTLWAAPFLGWVLFVSSWTKRKPILMVTIPIGVIAFLEFYYNRSTHFINAVWERVLGWVAPLDVTNGTHLGTGQLLLEEWDIYETAPSLLATSGMWYGLAIGGAFFAASVYVRRYRDESL